MAPEARGELGATVRDNCLRETVEFPHMVEEKVCQTFGVYGRVARNEMPHFREAVDHDANCVKSLGYWEARHEVDGNVLPGFVRDRQGTEGTMRGMPGRFGSPTGVAVTDVTLDVRSHGRPVVITREQLEGFCSPWVAKGRWFVEVAEKATSQGLEVGNVPTTLEFKSVVVDGTFGQRDLAAVTGVFTYHGDDT